MTREAILDKIRKLERLAVGTMGGERDNAWTASDRLRREHRVTAEELYPPERKRGDFAVTVRVPFSDIVRDEWTAIVQGVIFEKLLRRMVLDMGADHPLDMNGAVFATVREVEAPIRKRQRRKKAKR